MPHPVVVALVPAHDADAGEADRLVAADRALVRERRDRSSGGGGRASRTGGARASRWPPARAHGPARRRPRKMSMPALRYCGSVTSSYWSDPATAPSTSITSSAPSSGGSKSSADGAPHQRRTPSSARTSASAARSASTAERTITRGPSRGGVGCAMRTNATRRARSAPASGPTAVAVYGIDIVGRRLPSEPACFRSPARHAVPGPGGRPALRAHEGPDARRRLRRDRGAPRHAAQRPSRQPPT